jgi:hypothetical protein
MSSATAILPWQTQANISPNLIQLILMNFIFYYFCTVKIPDNEYSKPLT